MRAAVRASKLREASLNMPLWSRVRLHSKRALIHITCAIIIAALLYAIILVADFSFKVGHKLLNGIIKPYQNNTVLFNTTTTKRH